MHESPTLPLFPLLALLALGTGCSGGSGDSGSGGGGANQVAQVTLDLEVALASLGVPIAPITPTTNLMATSFSIAPALPPGLALDPATGTIAGTPTGSSARTVYTLTADFGTQQASETIELEVVPTGRYLLVGSGGATGGQDSALIRATVDVQKGELALAGVVPNGALDPSALALHPTGAWVYAAHTNDDSLSTRDLDATTGALGASTVTALGAGSAPRTLLVHPRGDWLYALLRGRNRIEVLALDAQTGAPTVVPSAGAATGASPEALAVDPSGSFLFCANEADGTVRSYAIDAATGTLTPVGAPVATGPFPRGLAAVDGYLYVSAPTQSKLVILSFDGAGALAFVADFALAGSTPTRLAAHPNGRALAVLDLVGDALETFTVDPATGALTPVGTSLPTPELPLAMRFDPSGAWLAVGGHDAATVALYAVDRQTAAPTEVARIAVAERPFDVLWTTGSGPLERYADLAFTSDDATSAVTTFTVDESSGDLSSEPSPPVAGPSPSGLTLDRTGRFLYAPDALAGTIAMFRVESGSPFLTALGASPTGQSELGALAIDPSSRFVAAASPTGGGVTSFVIDQGPLAFVEGDLIPATPPFRPTGEQPTALAFDRTGRFLFVGHAGTGPGSRTIDHFVLDPATGALLDPASPAPTPVNGLATDLLVHPDGRTLYVALTTVVGGTAAAWSLDPIDGTRTQILPVQPTGEVSRRGALDPSGRFLAIACGSSSGPGDVAVLSIDPATGALGAAVLSSAGLDPRAVAFDPGGERLYVAGGGGDVTRCDVDPQTGALTVTGTFPGGVSVNGLALRERRR